MNRLGRRDSTFRVSIQLAGAAMEAPGTEPILGAFTLEGFGLGDPADSGAGFTQDCRLARSQPCVCSTGGMP